MSELDRLNHAGRPLYIHFVNQASPVDQRLKVLGELRDWNGRRVWAGHGRNEADILAHAATWLDDCHGRAGHTPDILVDDTWPAAELAASIQHEVQARHARQLVQALIGNRA